MTPAPRGRRRTSAPERYIAFLRAINVGGHVVKMDALRAHFTRLGFGSVETFIASGNVIFEATGASPSDLEPMIAEELERRLGYEVATFVRSPAELAEIAGQRLFDPAVFDYDRHGLYVGFLPERSSAAAVRGVVGLRTPTDELHVVGRELYWGRRGSFSESKITGALIDRAVDAPMTVRNITTVRRLAAKYA